jgi:hypothetical protein
LLPSRQPQGAVSEAILDLVPQRGSTKAALDDPLELLAIADALDSRPVGDVFVDRLGKRIGLLEDHADPLPEGVHVPGGIVDALPLEEDVALDSDAVDQVIEPVETS